MTASASRAKGHAGGGPLERRVRPRFVFSEPPVAAHVKLATSYAGCELRPARRGFAFCCLNKQYGEVRLGPSTD